MSNAYVIGLGKSGISAARLLKRSGWEVTVSDRNYADTLLPIQAELAAEGITVQLGHTFEPDPTLVQRVVVSPGVRWDLPGLVTAKSMGIEVMGEMELAWKSLQNRPWVGVTGTNGKTTTTALIAAIFAAAGFRAPACGNIGYAACELAMSNPPPDWVIAELSSYQIEASSSVAPQVGVWTTFTPDHLERHGTLDYYYEIKAHLLRQSQWQVFNGDDPYLRKVASRWPEAHWTSIHGKDHLVDRPDWGTYLHKDWVISQGEPIIQASLLRMAGQHNLQNLLMAVAASRLAGINKDAIAQAIANFPGVPHRLEQIVNWRGIDFINDSKATNYDAAEVGLMAVAAPVILIAGGEAKAGDDTAWLQAIQSRAAAVLLIGDAAPAFAQRLKQAGYEAYEIVETIDRAVSRGAELAQQQQAKSVLLSPACASFDQYRSFEHRGEHFRQLCLEYCK